MKEYKIIYVEWVDSSHNTGWQTAEAALKEDHLLDCKTVGFLIKETDDHLTVAQSSAVDPDQVDGVLTIPKVAITKRKYL